jgi:hypothetical protein
MNEEPLYTFSCPACDNALSVPVSLAGVTGPCPLCHTTITAPAPQTAMNALAEQWNAQGQNLPAAPAYQEPSYAGYQDPNDGFWEDAPGMGDYLQQRVENEVHEHRRGRALHERAPLPVPDFSQPLEQSKPLPKAPSAGNSGRLLAAVVLGSLATAGLGGYTIYKNRVQDEAAARLMHEYQASQTKAAAEKATEKTTTAEPSVEGAPTLAALEPAELNPLAPEPTVAAPPETTIPAETTEPAPVAPVEPAPTEQIPSAQPEQPTVKAPPKPRIVEEAPAAAQSPTVLENVDSRTADPVLVTPTSPTAAVESASTDGETSFVRSRRVLDGFLAAKNWKERLPLILKPDLLRPEIEEYYREKPDGPIAVQSVTYMDTFRLPVTNRRMTIFHVACDGCEPIPVTLEETEEGHKVDWQAFVEFKDLRLVEYFKKFQEDAGIFRVVLRRSHYFGSGVPDVDGKLCFTVEPPVPGFDNNFVWIDKNNKELIEKLGVRAEFSNRSQPTVALRWVKNDASEPYVVLDDILSDAWRITETRKRADQRKTASVDAEKEPTTAKLATQIRVQE